MFCSAKLLSVLEDTGEDREDEDLEQGMCPHGSSLTLVIFSRIGRKIMGIFSHSLRNVTQVATCQF